MSRRNKNPIQFHADPHKHAIVELMRPLFARHNPYSVFTSFIEISALALSNRFDYPQFDKREKRYLEIAKNYTRDELTQFGRMLAELMLCYRARVDSLGPAGLRNDIDNIGDVLGSIYMLLEIGNDRMAQFFTPYNVSIAMAIMMLGDESGIREKIRENGFLTLSEPTCGAGGMVIAAAQAFHQLGFNYPTQLHATCVDIDPVCAQMTFLQLSLLGVPAIVIHGNSLSLETWDTWYTPPHILLNWNARLRNRREKERASGRQAEKTPQPAAETSLPEAPPAKESRHTGKLQYPQAAPGASRTQATPLSRSP